MSEVQRQMFKEQLIKKDIRENQCLVPIVIYMFWMRATYNNTNDFTSEKYTMYVRSVARKFPRE